MPAATRIEATELIFQDIEDKTREVISARDRDLIVDDIGVPQRVYNLAFTDGSTINVKDGLILVSLKEGTRRPVTTCGDSAMCCRPRFPR